MLASRGAAAAAIERSILSSGDLLSGPPGPDTQQAIAELETLKKRWRSQWLALSRAQSQLNVLQGNQATVSDKGIDDDGLDGDNEPPRFSGYVWDVRTERALERLLRAVEAGWGLSGVLRTFQVNPLPKASLEALALRVSGLRTLLSRRIATAEEGIAELKGGFAQKAAALLPYNYQKHTNHHMSPTRKTGRTRRELKAS